LRGSPWRVAHQRKNARSDKIGGEKGIAAAKSGGAAWQRQRQLAASMVLANSV